jgi:hypothetical protein
MYDRRLSDRRLSDRRLSDGRLLDDMVYSRPALVKCVSKTIDRNSGHA